MKLASVLTPLSDENLTLAAQMRRRADRPALSGPRPVRARPAQAPVQSFGMTVGVIEGYLPIERTQARDRRRHRPGAMKALVRHLGGLGDPAGLLQLHGRAPTGSAPSIDAPERGGAKTTAFDIAELESRTDPRPPAVPRRARAGRQGRPAVGEPRSTSSTSFIPVAEESGVVMAMHPDDPPLPQLLGNDRIMHDVEGFERLVALVAVALQQGRLLPGLLLRDGRRHPGHDPPSRPAHRLRPLPRRDRHRRRLPRDLAGQRADRHGRGDARVSARSASTARSVPITCRRCSARTTASPATRCSVGFSRSATSAP